MSKIRPKRTPNGDGERPEHRGGHTLGMGSEAAEGIHGVGTPIEPGAETALDDRSTGVGMRDGALRAGSEPLRDRSAEHTPGYGGEGGAPRTSSDEREHLAADGTLEGED